MRIDWDELRPFTAAQFLQRFTLHDSSLVSWTHVNGDGILLEIGFDLVWNKDIPTGYTELKLYFTRPYRVHWSEGSWFYNTIGDAQTISLDAAAKNRLLESSEYNAARYSAPDSLEIPHPAFEAALSETSIKVLNGSSLVLLHRDELKACVYNAEGKLIDLAPLI